MMSAFGRSIDRPLIEAAPSSTAIAATLAGLADQLIGPSLKLASRSIGGNRLASLADQLIGPSLKQGDGDAVGVRCVWFGRSIDRPLIEAAHTSHICVSASSFGRSIDRPLIEAHKLREEIVDTLPGLADQLIGPSLKRRQHRTEQRKASCLADQLIGPSLKLGRHRAEGDGLDGLADQLIGPSLKPPSAVSAPTDSAIVWPIN